MADKPLFGSSKWRICHLTHIEKEVERFNINTTIRSKIISCLESTKRKTFSQYTYSFTSAKTQKIEEFNLKIYLSKYKIHTSIEDILIFRDCNVDVVIWKGLTSVAKMFIFSWICKLKRALGVISHSLLSLQGYIVCYRGKWASNLTHCMHYFESFLLYFILFSNIF